MTHVTNLVCFPGIPHKAHFGSVKTAPGCDSAGSLAIRLLLKEIIDTARDGLSNRREADALSRIDELLILTIVVE
jgi:hypothetical protein